MKSSLCYLIAIHFIFFSFPALTLRYEILPSQKHPSYLLHSAAYIGDLKKVKELINSEDVNKDFKPNGGTPLYWAIRAFRMLEKTSNSSYIPHCIKSKVKEVCPPNNPFSCSVCVKKIKTPAVNYLEIIKLLIENGADVNARNRHQPILNTATDLIYKEGSLMTKIIKLLIENGANVNAIDNNSTTPLHEICYRAGTFPHNPHTLEVIKLLVEKGADLNIKDSLKRTALDYLTRKNPQHIKYLKSKGAKATIWYKKLMFLFY